MVKYEFVVFDEKKESRVEIDADFLPRIGEVIKYSVMGAEYKITDVNHIVTKRHNNLESVVQVKGILIK